MSAQFREALLDNLVKQGFTLDEMIKVAEGMAHFLEEGVMEKQANNPAMAAGGATAAGEIIRWLSTRLGNTSDTLMQGVMNMAGNATPLVLAGSVALPIAAGYYGGDMLSRLTDPGDARLEELKKREEIAELQAQTARIRQRQQAAMKSV